MNDYSVNKGLINSLIVSIITAIAVIGGYMVMWNRDDLAWKEKMDLRVGHIVESVVKIEARVNEQILPQAKWRLDNHDMWIKNHEKSHEGQR
jgi:hypothetical protein